MAKHWTCDELLGMARAYQPACVLAAAADLDLFGALSTRPMTALDLADLLGTDRRATAVLLDALSALALINKNGNQYSVPREVADVLSPKRPGSILPMVQHQANCLRRWVQLARVVQTGRPAERTPSIRGEAADQAAFIGAMHTASGPVADRLVTELGPLTFRHLLDVGGASGTWTIALLRAVPNATATLFDLPEVIPLARQRLAEVNLSQRVTLVAGDFYTDPLPAGADFAWLSAIAHQNSRHQNRELFAKIHNALEPQGVLMIRDLVMDESRTRPAAGAMFAINMLVGTPGGGTYTLQEYPEDLTAAGFSEITFLRQDDWMDSIIRASKS